MQVVTKHFVTFYYPGTLFGERSCSEVESRTAIPDLPEGAYAYKFHDVQEVDIDGGIFKRKADNYSPLHYVSGKVMTLAEVRRWAPDMKTLIANMECNDWNKIIFPYWPRTVWPQPLEKTDTVLESLI